MNVFHIKLTRSSIVVYVTIIVCIIYCTYWFQRILELEIISNGYESSDVAGNDAEDERHVIDGDTRIAKLREDYSNITKYPIFQSNEETEFPTIEKGIPRIPHIIHQIWNDESVPDNFVIPIQSFVEHNPTWEYRFWTYDSGRKLLADHHPYLVNVYDDFGDNVQKSDLLRYAVLYEFGGVYSDVDVKNTRSLDIATLKYACILPTETFEHSTILNDMLIFINTAVLLCRPKHPFFKELLLNLQLADTWGNPVHTTGPEFMTDVYMKYNNLKMSDLNRPKIDNNTNSPFFYKGTRHEEDEDGLYIPNTQYFMDTVDPFIIEDDGNLRDCVDGRPLSYLAKRGCAEFEHRRNIRKRRTFAFTIHYWAHLWAMDEHYKKSIRYLNVKDIIPNCVLYGDTA